MSKQKTSSIYYPRLNLILSSKFANIEILIKYYYLIGYLIKYDFSQNIK